MPRIRLDYVTKTWPVVTGCTPAGAGCAGCWAKRLAETRLSRLPDFAAGFWGNVTCHERRLGQPLSWQEPQRVFVAPTGDLFHELVPDGFIERVFHAMRCLAPHHTYLLLTKRAERMGDFLGLRAPEPPPPANVWLGVSVEDDNTARRRLPALRQARLLGWRTWVSFEPAIGPVNWKKLCAGGCEGAFEWLVSGGESGPTARPSHLLWHRAARDFCQGVAIPFFFRQWGEWYCAPFEPDPTFSGGQCLRLPFGEAVTRKLFTRGGEKYRLLDAGCGAVRLGRDRAARLLDGREWNQMPFGDHCSSP